MMHPDMEVFLQTNYFLNSVQRSEEKCTTWRMACVFLCNESNETLASKCSNHTTAKS